MAAKKKNTERKIDIPQNINPMFYGFELDEEQLDFANSIWSRNYDIIFCNSKAGTGKTTIATGVANLLVHYKLFDSIVYIMSPYGESKQGWLPGTITEKSSVYFEAFYQALEKCGVNLNTAINNESMVNQKKDEAYITCITDTFLRGTNLDNAVIIIDESQNCTVAQLKKILTRVGEHAKVVVIGHNLQCDLNNSDDSGFSEYINHFKDKKRAKVCKLTTNHRGWISNWADELQG